MKVIKFLHLIRWLERVLFIMSPFKPGTYVTKFIMYIHCCLIVTLHELCIFLVAFLFYRFKF